MIRCQTWSACNQNSLCDDIGAKITNDTGGHSYGQARERGCPRANRLRVSNNQPPSTKRATPSSKMWLVAVHSGLPVVGAMATFSDTKACRLVPMDGHSMGRLLGPKGRCTLAAWSPDGKWMYFSVEIARQQHL